MTPEIDHEPTEEEKRYNGWTSEKVREYNEGVDRYHLARHFGGSYGEPELDDMMQKERRAKAIRIETIASRDPLKW